MGADFFARLARDYARAHPPEHGRLLEYGFDLPGFVAGYEAAGRYPWFADVGRLELAWHRGLRRGRGGGAPGGRARGRPPPPEWADSRARAASFLPAARLPVSGLGPVAHRPRGRGAGRTRRDGGGSRMAARHPTRGGGRGAHPRGVRIRLARFTCGGAARSAQPSSRRVRWTRASTCRPTWPGCWRARRSSASGWSRDRGTRLEPGD